MLSVCKSDETIYAVVENTQISVKKFIILKSQ